MIINLTQHAASSEQVNQGVFNAEVNLTETLTFDGIPSKAEIKARAEALVTIALEADASSAMIGGAPYLMAPLENALKEAGIRPLYAFSERESVEKTMPDGTVRKINIFKHLGFVEA